MRLLRTILPFMVLWGLLSTQFLWAQSAEAVLERAEARYRAGNYLLALEDYQEFATEYPLSDRTADVQYRIGVCQYRLGRDVDAVATFRRMERRHTNTRYFDYIYLWAGLSLYRLGAWDEAIESLTSFDERITRGDNAALKARALLTIGLAHLELEHTDAAEQALLRYLEDYPQNEQAVYASLRLTHLYLSSDRYQEALDRMDALGPPPPAYSDLPRFYRAEALWGLDRRIEAKDVYTSLLDADAAIASVAYRRLFQLAEGDLSRMEALVQQAEQNLASRPELLRDLWTRVGVESYRAGSEDMAEYFLSRVWRTDSASPAAGLYLAEARIKKNRPDQAIPVLEEIAASSTPHAGQAVLRLGDLELAGGNYARAAEIYQRYLHDNPQGPRRHEATTLLAYCYYRTGEAARALSLTETLLGDPEAVGSTGLQKDLSRLQAAILEAEGQPGRAADILSRYTASSPGDFQARLDLAMLYYTIGNHAGVVEETRALLDEGVQSEEPRIAVTGLYLKGLSEIALKRYPEAAASLSRLSPEDLEKEGLSTLVPYTLYYLGWTYYRMQAYEAAKVPLYRLIDTHLDHPLRDKAVYLAGWCLYSLGDFGTALPFFQELAAGRGADARRSEFLAAKCLVNLDRLDQAETALEKMVAVRDALADDVLYELADVRARAGDVDDACETFLLLSDRYPDSTLAEESLYRRGVLYRDRGSMQEAAEAFRLHRLRHPDGEQVGGSLYWGGLSVYQTGHPTGAILLWELLIEEYPGSPFRPDALRRSAAVFQDQGNHSRALQLYTELLRAYPHEAGDAAERADELRFLLLGLGRREAELTAVVQNKGGAGTAAGRDAMLELARLYIYDESGKVALAYQVLQTLLEAGDKRAHFLMGEYHERMGHNEEAAKAFLEAAVAAGGGEPMATSLYRAAVAMDMAGKVSDVRAIIGRLEAKFPGSPWTDRARDLLEVSR